MCDVFSPVASLPLGLPPKNHEKAKKIPSHEKTEKCCQTPNVTRIWVRVTGIWVTTVVITIRNDQRSRQARKEGLPEAGVRNFLENQDFGRMPWH